MSDQSQSTVTVPDELQKKFPKLIALILGSESMNDEERQYWINILPVMTPEQQDNLQQILENEKNQLAAIDAKYEKEMKKLGTKEVVSVQEMQNTRREKRSARSAQEGAAEEEERRKEEEILNAIAELDG